MRNAGNWCRWWCLAVLAAWYSVAAAEPILTHEALGLQQTHIERARGGQTTFWFNPAAMQPLGLKLMQDMAPSGEAGGYVERRFTADPSSALTFTSRGGRFAAMRAGSLTHLSGPRLQLADGTMLNLRGFRIVARGAGRIGLAVADSAGTVWLNLDHAHVLQDESSGTFAIRHMDLRIAAALAERLGRAEWNGMLIGGAQWQAARVDLLSGSTDAPSGGAAARCSAVWPTDTLRPDVRMLRLANNWEERQPDGINVYRCGRDDGVGGHSRVCTRDSDDGLVVLSPDASLRNEGDASVAWHPKFSAPAAPYGNDQHPFLVWNMYRLDADGRLRQIGASPVKHAFHTINAACGCEGGEILYPGCEDTYGGFSNDFPTAFAPRAEIIPRTAQWARCGSFYDRDCNGERDSGDGLVADDAYSPLKHMRVRESELNPSTHPGATWFVEYWYVVRDDADPWNTIGLMQVLPSKVPGQGSDPNAWLWRFEVLDFRNGSMADAWGDATATNNEWHQSSHVESAKGRVALGTRVRQLDAGHWRYDYTLFNLDFASTVSSGDEPNLRLLSSTGIASLSMPIAAAVALTGIEFDAGPASEPHHWNAVRDGSRLTWSALADATLDWGNSYAFSYIADRPPRDGKARISGGDQAIDRDLPTLLPDSAVPVRRRLETMGDVAPPR